MRTRRHLFQPDGAAADPARWCAPLRSGIWLVEAGAAPPPEHRPSRLLSPDLLSQRIGVMALSLRTASLLALDLGPTLVDRLKGEGCAIAELAALAVHEMLLNAAIHGNLDVSSGHPREWGDLAAREARIQAALREPARATRVVTVALGWDIARVVAVIADQGRGYDAASVWGRPGGREREAAGRGLLIAATVARVEVRRGGRCHRLVFDRHETKNPGSGTQRCGQDSPGQQGPDRQGSGRQRPVST